jgi:membrane protein DedA with SNARE-associated domain
VEPLAVAGLAALLLVKEAGVPIPVPGDLLVIGAGVAVAEDPGAAALVLAVILGVGYAGGVVQFVLARRVLRGPLLSMLARVGVAESRVDALADRLRRTGARGVAVARMTPGVRIGATAAAGIASVPFAAFLMGLVIGNGVFVTGHFALGYLLGPSATDAIASVGTLGVVAIAAALAIVGGVAWSVVRRRRAPARASGIGDWADACCPACLALVALAPDAAAARSTG